MPLVRIDASSTIDDDRLTAFGEAVHQAMTETINVPADDIFQIHTTHDRSRLRYDPDYLGVHRDDGIVFVTITLLDIRTDEQKRALYRRITELAAERAGVEPRNVQIVLTENKRIDWSFGEGIAQMAPGQ